MSTLKVESIQHPSSSTPAISLDSNGAMTGSFPAPNRNIIYNGAMQVAQRGTSAAGITGSDYYTADRWAVGATSLGTWTQSVENDAPTGSGFCKSLKMLCTTADAAPAGGDSLAIIYSPEGQDLQRIAKGTSAAKQLTVSFWVKSNVTGTYVFELVDADNTRHVCASYSVSSSATWEKKVLTLPPDTTGAFDNDNGASLRIRWWLGSGTDFTSGTLATTWASTTSVNRAVGQTNLAANTNNYWQITGVQLETGPVATEFEFEPYGTTLAKCQRYYYRLYAANARGYCQGASDTTTTAIGIMHFPVSMRATPSSLETTGNASDYRIRRPNTNVTCSSIPVLSNTTQNNSLINFIASGLTAGESVGLWSNNNAGYLAWSAEL